MINACCMRVLGSRWGQRVFGICPNGRSRSRLRGICCSIGFLRKVVRLVDIPWRSARVDSSSSASTTSSTAIIPVITPAILIRTTITKVPSSRVSGLLATTLALINALSCGIQRLRIRRGPGGPGKQGSWTIVWSVALWPVGGLKLD